MSNLRLRRRALLIGLSVLAMVWALLPAAAGAQESGDEALGFEEHSVVTLSIPDQATMMALVDAGFDLDHNMERVGDGYTVTAILTPSEEAAVEALGVGVDLVATPEQMDAQHEALVAEWEGVIEAEEALAASLGIEQIDTVVIARADYFTSGNSRYLAVEAKNIAGTGGGTMTLRYFDEANNQLGQLNMSAFTDAGQYMYHTNQITLATSPPTLAITAPTTGSWPGVAAAFGGAFPAAPASAPVELVNDGSATPTLGCFPYVGFTPGAIAVVDRGDCTFVIKAEMAQASGASALIVVNNVTGAATSMTGTTSATIPAMMVTQANGNLIKPQLPASAGTASQPVPPRPYKVSVTSANGGFAEKLVKDWLGPITAGPAHRYFTGFLNRYHNSLEYYELIEELHAQFPDLTEIIDMPYITQGYDRPGMALFGGTGSAAVGITSNAMGSAGGTDITVQFVNPGAPDSPLSVSVTPGSPNAIVVSLATNAASALSSTAAQVRNAINASPEASALVHAYTYRNNAGGGTVAAVAATQLSSYLNAPASIPRGPIRPKVLRIGKVRDGSKTGVFGYSAEHAREWQTPLVGVETAYRLLHNYATDHKTKQLVDNLDIFILPVTNPGGEMYSKYDFASQRRNMVNYCARTGNYDLNARNTWGVDNNRNYSAYSLFDGYSGASTSCTNDTYAGPAELSEPESANIAWMAGAYPNIKFSMNIHSSGNYYMWAPGSYATPGRISAPRPSFGEENFFFEMAERNLTAIKQHRGLSVTPARTGPIADVLYSAAGNSADMLWYDFGIYGFSFEVGTSFQPSFAGGAGSEAWNQMMEFSNGLVDLFDTAMTWTRDRYAPTSWINEDISSPSAGPVGITFNSSEPVDIYYTTDGSNPTTASTQYLRAGIREGGEKLWFDTTTTIKWFSVDMAGNVEGKYDPKRNNAKTATIVITP